MRLDSARSIAPGSTVQTAEAMREASQAGEAVLVRGAGTKLGWGADPERLDVVVEMTGMGRVLEHAAGDLVVHVEAGIRLSALQEALAGAGQQLALDTPFGDGTVGGALATGASGPRRLLYGTPRDLLIGITVVRADGTVAKAGGKVVKNVAGYDLGRLMAGSFGTLAVITEAVFRLHPLPRDRRFVTATYDTAEAAAAAVAAVVGSQTVPSAVEVHRASVDGPVEVGVLVEGVPQGVTARAAVVAKLLGGGQDREEAPPWWGRYAGADGGLLLRMAVPPGELGRALAAAERLGGEWEVPLVLNGSAAGTLYLTAPSEGSAEQVRGLASSLREAAQSSGGSVVVLQAPPGELSADDVWGPVPALDLMRRVKESFDPHRLLAPGRFVGGI